MALQELSNSTYKVQEGFCDIFSEIINCEIYQPTFNDGYTDKRQFVKKRDGWINLFSMSKEIIDYYKYNDDYYVLEKINSTSCTLWKVSKDVNGLYTVKVDLTPAYGIVYDSTTNIRGTVEFSSPDITSIKTTNSTPTNITDPTINPYGDYSDTLRDTTRSFDNSYFNTYGVITSHTEDSVKDITVTIPPVSPSNGDRYIVATGGTGAWSTKDGQIAEYDSGSLTWVFTVPQTGYFVWSVAQSKTYRCVVTAGPVYTWSNVPIDNGWKEGTRFDVQAVLDNNTLRIVSNVTINNYDTYSIYGVLSNYAVFKMTGNDTVGKIGINPLNDSVLYHSNFAGVRDLVVFDGSLFGITANRLFQKSGGQELSKTSTQNYYFYESELYSLDSTGDFLFIGADNRTYALVRIAQQTTGDFNYAKRELTQFGLFSKKSILTYGGSMYVLLNDRRWYGLNLSFTSQSAQVQLKDVGVKVQHYLDQMEVGDYVEGFWYNGNFGFTFTGSYNSLIRYNEPFQGFLVDEYAYAFKYFELDDNIVSAIYSNSLYEKGGISDDDADIEQRIVIIAPEGVVGTPFRSVMGRFLFGYNGETVKWRVSVEIDSEQRYDTLVWDSERFRIVQLLNAFGNGTLGTRILGGGVLGIGGGAPYAGEYGIVGLRIGRTCTINKFTFTNFENSNLIFGRFDLLYETASPMIVPIRDVG